MPVPLGDIQGAVPGLPVTHVVIHAPDHAHFHPEVAGVEVVVETGAAEVAGVVVKVMVAVEELVLLAEEVIGLLVDPL